MDSASRGIAAATMLALFACSGTDLSGISGNRQESPANGTGTGTGDEEATPPAEVSGTFLADCGVATAATSTESADLYGCVILDAASKAKTSAAVSEATIKLTYGDGSTAAPAATIETNAAAKWHVYFPLPVAQRETATVYELTAVVAADSHIFKGTLSPVPTMTGGAECLPKSFALDFEHLEDGSDPVAGAPVVGSFLTSHGVKFVNLDDDPIVFTKYLGSYPGFACDCGKDNGLADGEAARGAWFISDGKKSPVSDLKPFEVQFERGAASVGGVFIDLDNREWMEVRAYDDQGTTIGSARLDADGAAGDHDGRALAWSITASGNPIRKLKITGDAGIADFGWGIDDLTWTEPANCPGP